MKIATLNLQGFINWEDRQDSIVRYFQSIDADIILFQEVVYIDDHSPYNQVQLLNQVLKYPYEQSVVTRLQPSHQYAVFREGLAVLSKHPITTSDAIILKKAAGDEHNRLVQLFDVQYQNSVIKLTNVHFSITDVVDFATPHLKETLDILEARNETRFIGGDFNLSHLEDSVAFWGSAYTASNQVPYISFPEEQKRIDYLLAPKPHTITSVTLSDDTLSDHRAVVFEVSL